jgi:hypothetical protein
LVSVSDAIMAFDEFTSSRLGPFNFSANTKFHLS